MPDHHDALQTDRFTQPAITGTHEPLPPLSGRLGPITGRKIRTVTLVYGAAYGLAAVLWIMNLNSTLTGFALGLMWPGGSFLYGHHYLAGALALGAFLVSVTAHRYLLPCVWLGSAIVGALWAGHDACPHSYYSLPVISLGLVALLHWASHRGYKRDLKAEQAVNTLLQHNPPITLRSAPGRLGEELSDADLAHSKFILDRALQPLEEFNGLGELEPFGTSALRYQLNYAQYALALYNYSHTPAFSGYLHEAQRRLIDKMTDHKAWRYWALENRWGNLDSNPDPIRRDNIMFSAYLGQMIGMYQTLSGDTRYNQPGALTFRTRNHSAQYSLQSLNNRIFENFQRSEFCLYPCEPNWSYTMCNPFGLNSLLLNDRLLGSALLPQLEERYEHNLRQEFTFANGRYVPLRSTAWGFNLPRISLGVNDGLAAYLHHPCLPGFAETTWEMMRYQNFNPSAQHPFSLPKVGRVDIGNYRHSRKGPYAAVLMAAKEMGDQEVYAAVNEAIHSQAKTRIEEGELIYQGCSNLTSFMLAVAAFGRPAAFHDLLRTGMPEAWRSGPMLAEVPYPDVLVYRAVSDGKALELGLKANINGTHRLLLSRLQPNTDYRAHGSNITLEFTAGPHGDAVIYLHLHQRQQIMITPIHYAETH